MRPFYVYIPEENKVKLVIDKIFLDKKINFITVDNVGVIEYKSYNKCNFLKFEGDEKVWEIEKFERQLLQSKRKMYEKKKILISTCLQFQKILKKYLTNDIFPIVVFCNVRKLQFVNKGYFK